MKSLTVEEISKIVGGTINGSTDQKITGAQEIPLANPDQIIMIGNKKYISQWEESQAVVALIDEKIEHEPAPGKVLIKVKDADLALAKLLELLAPAPPLFDEAVHHAANVHVTVKMGNGCKIGAGSYIGPKVRLGDNVTIYPNVTIMDESVIGANTVIWPGTVIRERCQIGSHCILHSNVSIGSDGFGFRPGPDGKSIVKIPQIGIVKIGNAVEIGSGSCIDRAKLSATIIGDGTKIDNMVQVGHNTRIGRMCLIAGHVSIAGSVVLGDGVILGGQTAIKEHIKVGNRVVAGGRSGIMNDIPDGETVLGLPAVNYRETLKQWAILKRMGKKDS